MAKLQIKAMKVIMGCSLIYEETLKSLSMSKLSQMMTKVKYGNIYKYLKGLNTRGIHQCQKFVVTLFYVYVMLHFASTIVGTFLTAFLKALKPRALPKPKGRKNAPVRNPD